MVTEQYLVFLVDMNHFIYTYTLFALT